MVSLSLPPDLKNGFSYFSINGFESLISAAFKGASGFLIRTGTRSA
jgi:hypothetical protein